MNKKLILTSMLAIAVAGPALAETFPTTGEMQPNKTYENAATYTNMGVYSGTATAEPQYDINSYDITAGEYLAANGITGTTCPSGSYCSGGTFAFSDNDDQGMESCPADFNLSAAGTISIDNCYRECTTADVAHSTSVSGGYYYGDNNQCSATSCARGYSSNKLFDTETAGIGFYALSGDGEYFTDGEIFGDWFANDAGPLSWITTFDYGVVTGKALCAENEGEYSEVGSPEGTEGWACWCQIDGYASMDYLGEKTNLSGAWVYFGDNDEEYNGDCPVVCPRNCAYHLQNDVRFRAAMFNAIGDKPVAMCEADMYTINAGEYLAANGIEGTQCPAGSYCGGGTYTFSETNTQGLASCPSDYSLSAEGTKTPAECYRQCTYSDVAHSKENGTFTGMFFNYNNNKCEPVNDSSCADGYHYTVVNLDTSMQGTSVRYKAISSKGWSKGDTTGLKAGDWDVTFSYGTIAGTSSCSYATRECWCKINEYTPVGGNKLRLSSSSVSYGLSGESVFECELSCANVCAAKLEGDYFFRAKLFGSVDWPAICEANDITIDWGNGTPTSCKYDGDITTPETGVEKTGYTFKGWKFNKNANK